MSADRPGGWWQRLWGTVRRGYIGVLDGGKESAVVALPPGSVQLQLTVWEQRL